MLAPLNGSAEFFILARMEGPTPTRRRQFGRRALIIARTSAVPATKTRAAPADAAVIGIGYIGWAEQRRTIPSPMSPK